MFNNAYRGKRVLVTGHTGFKGSWLTTWLLKLGAEVIGVSREVLTEPAMFDELGLANKITHHLMDVSDLSAVKEILHSEKPDYVFHLAAQAIVSESYENPVETMTTNIVGTMNVLEALRLLDEPCIGVFITSDKCYDNVEWSWGYRESDHLGGKDIYSGSKGAAELVIKSYVKSFFDCGSKVRIGVGRAGNVLGGGDWAKDRIVVDAMKAWSKKRIVNIRSPNATRPWQHVLEPLSGYLRLGQMLQKPELQGEAFNFGPRAEQNHTVAALLEDLANCWGFSSSEEAYRVSGEITFNEAGLLKLNCDKALTYLKWEPNLAYQETIQFVGDWYREFYQNNNDMYRFSLEQIQWYEDIALKRERIWSHDK